MSVGNINYLQVCVWIYNLLQCSIYKHIDQCTYKYVVVFIIRQPYMSTYNNSAHNYIF